MGKYEEVLEEVQESKGSKVPRSRGPKVPGSKGPRYLKLTFKYELDSKEGRSCLAFILTRDLTISNNQILP